MANSEAPNVAAALLSQRATGIVSFADIMNCGAPGQVNDLERLNYARLVHS
jgi:hypothetical protein